MIIRFLILNGCFSQSRSLNCLPEPLLIWLGYIGWPCTILEVVSCTFLVKHFQLLAFFQIILGQFIPGCMYFTALFCECWDLIQNFNVSLPSSSLIFCSTRDHWRKGGGLLNTEFYFDGTLGASIAKLTHLKSKNFMFLLQTCWNSEYISAFK